MSLKEDATNSFQLGYSWMSTIDSIINATNISCEALGCYELDVIMKYNFPTVAAHCSVQSKYSHNYAYISQAEEAVCSLRTRVFFFLW